MKQLALALTLLLPSLASAGEGDAVRAAMEAAARRALPASVVEIELHGLSTRGRVEVPEGAELRVRTDGDEDWLGKVAADIDVIVDGSSVGTLTAVAEVAAYVEVPVTQGVVNRGDVLRPADVGFARRDVASLPHGVITDLRVLVGRQLKRDLGLNQLLRDSDLEDRMDARRNQPVMLVIASGSLRVTAPGMLQRDARLGDLVEVLALDTKTTVYGLLTAPDTGELVGATPVASATFGSTP